MFKKRLFILIKLFFYFIVDNIVNFIYFFIPTKKSNKILIFSPNSLGDFVIFLDSLKEYKSFYKNNEIILFCDTNLYDLAKKLNFIDKIFVVNYKFLFFGKNLFNLYLNIKTIFYRIKIIYLLKKNKFKKIINPINLFYISIFIKNLNSCEKIGIKDKNKFFGDKFSKMYTKTVKINKNNNELNMNADFFRKITNKKNFLSSLPKFQFPIKKYFKNDLDYMCLQLGGSFFEKCYKIENFAILAEKINTNLDICLLGIKEEIYLTEKFLTFFKGKNKILNFVGKTNITELISIIKFSKFLIGNDSGLIHIAVATKTPSICILSGHSYGFCNPYNVESILKTNDKYILPICIYKKMECFNCGTQKSCKYKLSENKKFRCIENIKLSMCLEKIKKSHLKKFFNIE